MANLSNFGESVEFLILSNLNILQIPDSTSHSTVQSAYAQNRVFPEKDEAGPAPAWPEPGISGRNPILGVR